MVLPHVSILRDHPLKLIKTHGTTTVTTHTCYSIAATTPELTIEILNSVF